MDADKRKDSLSEVIFDGMAMPPFRPLRLHAKKRFEDIRNLDTHADDVIISSYPKSGLCDYVSISQVTLQASLMVSGWIPHAIASFFFYNV